MKSFSEQLSEYVQRVGVSDAELARRLGVSRQTVFRWREGLTHGPRRRGDVLQIASRLRLSLAERDALLLAAGFAPQGAPEAQPGTPPAEQLAPLASQPGPPLAEQLGAVPPPPSALQPAPDPAAGMTPPTVRRAVGPRWYAAAVIAALLLGALAFPEVRRQLAGQFGLGAPPTQTGMAQVSGGATLVLVSQFANYSGAQVGYNIAGRLQEALQGEFASAGLTEVQVLAVEQSPVDERGARELAASRGAALVVWGEYDSGRVVAWVSAPEPASGAAGVQRRWLVLSPDQLSAAINTDLPQEVRWMALYVLGRVHLLAGRLDQAEAALIRAQGAPPGDAGSLAAVDYYLGLIESLKPQADLNQVIAYYSEAVSLQPGLAAAVNNRGAAYLERNASGDLQRAEADFRRALFLSPDDQVPLFNLALALARQGSQGLPEALELLEQAELSDPNSAGVQNALCWFLGLSGSPEQALSHCDRAVALDPSGYSNDSRGLALALLDRPQEAAAEFRKFLDRLDADDPQGYERYAPSRLEWLAALDRGENPFDRATLDGLLQE